MPAVTIPDPALVVLIGPSGSGKSTWASAHYRQDEIVGSDRLRAIVGSGEQDLDASADAFALLDQIVAARLRRGLTTVVDTLGLDQASRMAHLERARLAGLPAVAVLFSTSAAECKRRNRSRTRPVPAAVLDGQLRRMPAVAEAVAAEGWTLVAAADPADADPAGADPAAAGPATPAAVIRTIAGPEPSHAAGSRAAAAAQRADPARLGLVLQISRFGWGDDPAGWLASVAAAAAEAGLAGIALMDHLIQIPQVGRDWEAIPEPWVTLGLLAGLTSGLRLGTLVSPVTFRAPGLLAKTVATLDALSGGRAFCGLGAGWWEREHAAYGLPFPPPGHRLDQLESAIETLRALWRPGTRAYAGGRVALPETTCYPRPVAGIPIIVGGGGDRTLRIAARLADGCNLPADLATFDARLAVLRGHCDAAGRDPAEVAVTVLDTPVVGADRDEVAEIIERHRGRHPAARYARQHHAGTAVDHIGRYRLLAQRGVSTVFVSLPDLTGPREVLKLAPVAAAFA